MNAFFVSDVHLRDMGAAPAPAFLQFLETLGRSQSISHLFLVGDIFDLWLGKHHCFPDRFSPIVNELYRLARRGVEIHYFEGNHDLYLEEFWATEQNVFIHPRGKKFEIAGKTLWVEHGDEIDRSDYGYLFLRWFLRLPLIRWIINNMPSSWVAAIGEKASHRSREYTSTQKIIPQTRILSLLHEHACRIAERENVDLVINGHFHVQDTFNFKVAQSSCTAINLGSWLSSHAQVLQLNEEGLHFQTIKTDLL